METLTIELNTSEARKLIDDLVDLGIISLTPSQSNWIDLWNKLDRQLPQTEPGVTETEIMDEIRAYRREKRVGQSVDPARES